MMFGISLPSYNTTRADMDKLFLSVVFYIVCLQSVKNSVNYNERISHNSSVFIQCISVGIYLFDHKAQCFRGIQIGSLVHNIYIL